LWEIFYLKKVALKVLSVMVLVGISHVIYVSNSSQGLLVLIIGGLMFIGIKFFSSSKKATRFYFSMFGLASTMGVLGLLQIGPLTKFVYQSSTTYRGDYYRAAWRMFESHPISGVGIDRFGEYYRSYRDMDAAFRLGPSSVVNYAHNLFLQQLATGGVFLFLAYLAFIIVVASAAKKGLKYFKGDDRLKFGALVSLWFAHQVQTQVSIDQITIAAIGWVLAGAVVALGFNSELIKGKAFRPNTYAKNRRGTLQTSTLVSVALSLVLVVTTFAWLVPIWQADKSIKIARTFNSASVNENLISQQNVLVAKTLALAPREIRYKILAAEILVGIGKPTESRNVLLRAIEDDPRSFAAHEYLAQNYEISGDYKAAIQIRNKITRLDSFDTNNWFLLGKNLSKVNDYKGLEKVIERVGPLARKSTIVDDLRLLKTEASPGELGRK
jgi:tetratricopeptide (TPR) repeat protein